VSIAASLIADQEVLKRLASLFTLYGDPTSFIITEYDEAVAGFTLLNDFPEESKTSFVSG